MQRSSIFPFCYRFLFCSSLLLSAAGRLEAQSGCTDPLANNYSSSATVNNGLCTYNTTFYQPSVRVAQLEEPTLNENSALVYAGGSIWTLNDSGNEPAIYRIDTSSGAVVQKVLLEGATNVDWEELAFDGAYFYIGDFGNNTNGARDNLRIYKIALSEIPPATQQTAILLSSQVTIIDFSYSDQPRPLQPTSGNGIAYDCEAMLVDEGGIHLFTKNWTNSSTSHYVINSTDGGTRIAQYQENLPTGFLVTAAAKVPNRDAIVLLGYGSGFPFNHFLQLLYGYSGGKYFNGNKRQLNLPNVSEMGQAEGLTFINGAYGFISNEKVPGVNAKLRAIDVAAYLPAGALALDLQQFSASATAGKYQVRWTFASAVDQLSLSTGSTPNNWTKTTLSPGNAVGQVVVPAMASQQYFQLQWRGADGETKSSPVVFARQKIAGAITGLHLFKTGTFTFEAGNFYGNVQFSFNAMDGRQLGRRAVLSVAAGRHSFQMPGLPMLPKMVAATVTGNGFTRTQLLFVE